MDYFFHAYALKKKSTKQFGELKEQDRLEFTPVLPDDRGPRAVEVEYLDE